MKRKFISLTLLFAGVFMLASCLSDDTDDSNIVYYGDAAIKSNSKRFVSVMFIFLSRAAALFFEGKAPQFYLCI